MHLYVDQYTVPMRRVLSCNSRSSAGTEDTRDIQTAERSVELFERPVFLGLQSPKVPKAVWRCLCGASGHCGQPKALAISPGTSSTCCATWVPHLSHDPVLFAKVVRLGKSFMKEVSTDARVGWDIWPNKITSCNTQCNTSYQVTWWKTS